MLQTPEKTKWIEAVKLISLDSLEENKVWTVVKIPSNKFHHSDKVDIQNQTKFKQQGREIDT